MNKKILLVFFLTILFMLSGHLMDIGDNIPKPCNGFFCIKPNQLFHIGYYGMYVWFIILALFALNVVDGK